MTASATDESVRKTVRRHIVVSLVAACAILGLVMLNLPAKVVVGTAMVIAIVVAGTGMHLFSERPAIQVLIGFTAFFVFMLISWSYETFTDEIHGTVSTTYDAAAPVAAEESH